MKERNRKIVRIVFYAVFAAVCSMIGFGGPKTRAAAVPKIVGQEAVLYMDGRDEISVLGDNVRSVTYSSSAADIAEIDSSGVIVPRRQGTAEIQAVVTYGDGENDNLQRKELSYQLTVLDSYDNYFVYKNGVICGLTKKGKSLRDVYIPGYHDENRITAVYENVFDKNNTMERVFLSDNVEYMDYFNWEESDSRYSVFDGCRNLKEIHIGKHLKSIGRLGNLPSMQIVTVHPENQDFEVRENVLFSHNHLLLYPVGKRDNYYILPDSVAYIDDYAFSGVKYLQRIKFPDGLKSIGERAFEGTGLVEARIPFTTSLGYRAFYCCYDLEKVILPNKLPKKGYIFEKCTSLKNVIFPETATNIFGSNFSGCRALEGFQIADGKYGNGEEEDIKKGKLEVQDGVLFIKYEWSDIRVLLIYPPGKKDKKYTIPYMVDTIMNEAFYSASNLENIVLPNSLKNIWGDAFCNCSSLQSIHLPKKAYIASGTRGYFAGCKSLAKITVASSDEDFAAVEGVLYNKAEDSLYCFPQGKKVEKFTLSKKIVRIKAYAFADNRYLKEISGGKNVRLIRKGAFYNAKALKSISLSSRMKEIEKEVFYNCTNLRKIVIPNNVNTLQKGAFSRCTALKSVVVGKSVKYILEDVFRDCWSMRTLTFKGKKWQQELSFDTIFLNMGSKNYKKLSVNIPKCTKKEKSTCRKVLKAAGLHKKAKIKFTK